MNIQQLFKLGMKRDIHDLLDIPPGRNPDTTSWDANPWVWVVAFRRIVAQDRVERNSPR